jgi:CRP/FNR family transcriptional regulator, anaerobic regulatory protein
LIRQGVDKKNQQVTAVWYKWQFREQLNVLPSINFSVGWQLGASKTACLPSPAHHLPNPPSPSTQLAPPKVWIIQLSYLCPMNTLADIAEFKASPELIERLYNDSILKTYHEGDIILNENAYIRAIPIVTKGSIKVIRTEEDGREILLYYIKAGESCIMSFLGGMHNETSKVRAEVEEDAEILFLPMEKVGEYIREYPQWLDYIFRLYHKRFEELLTIINAIAFKKVDERLLALLHKKADLTGNHTILVTHEQLANELGTARVVVSRLLKQLEENGQLQLGRNKIKLL